MKITTLDKAPFTVWAHAVAVFEQYHQHRELWPSVWDELMRRNAKAWTGKAVPYTYDPMPSPFGVPHTNYVGRDDGEIIAQSMPTRPVLTWRVEGPMVYKQYTIS